MIRKGGAIDGSKEFIMKAKEVLVESKVIAEKLNGSISFLDNF